MQFKNQPRKFREFLDSELARAIVADEGTVLAVNAAFCDALKLPHAGIAGRPLSEFIAAEEWAAAREHKSAHAGWKVTSIDEFGNFYCEVTQIRKSA